MKKFKRTIALIITLLIISTNTAAVFAAEDKALSDNMTEENLEEVLAILKKNERVWAEEKITFKEAKLLIETIYPELLEYIDVKDLYKWVENSEGNMNLINLGDAIHEENHYYSYNTHKNPTISNIKRNFKGLGIWITYKNKDKIFTFYNVNGKKHTITPSKTFTANKIINVIPEDLRGQFSSYYVMNKDSMTYKTGIFGMINEYNSFCKEFVFYSRIAELIDDERSVYKIRISNDYENLIEVENNIIAYLLYAKKNYPNYYEKYLNNTELRQVYGRLKDIVEDIALKHNVIKDSDIFKVLEIEEFKEIQEEFYMEEPIDADEDGYLDEAT